MKKTMFLIACLLAFGISTSGVFAKETIDLQQYVSCGFDSCTLSVDINELDLSKDAKDFLKYANQENLNIGLSDLPENIREFDYFIQDHEKLIVTAKIQPASSNYWFFEFEDFILDPWFNSSYQACVNISMEETAGYNRVNDLVNYNFTNLSFTTPWELKLVNASCEVSGTEQEFNLISYGSGTFASLTWVMNLTAYDNEVWSLYYDADDVFEDHNNISLDFVAWYRFEDDTLDYFNRLYNGVIQGVPDCDVTGQRGNYACRMTASTDYIYHENLLDHFYNPTYIFAWVNWDSGYSSGQGYQNIFGKRNEGAGTDNALFMQAFNDDGKIKQRKWYNSGAEVRLETTQTTWTSDTWYHFGVACGSTTNLLYYNGSVSDSDANTNCIEDGTSQNFIMGSDSGATSQYLKGKIDDILIINRTLTTEEILSLSAPDDIAISLGNVVFQGAPIPETNETIVPEVFSICFDEDTLINYDVKIINGNVNNTTSYIHCYNGCYDNSCRIDRNLEYAIIIGIVLLCLYVTYRLLK